MSIGADGIERVRLPGDGLMLTADAFGDPAAPPVLFFHGGGQSRRSWRGAARRVADAGYRALSVDLRGHGESDWAADGDYALDAIARDVEAIVDSLEGPVALVGASRGGQAAFVGGARRAERVRLVFLADVAPRIEHRGVERIRGFFRASAAGFADVAEAAATLDTHLGHPGTSDPARLGKVLRREGDRLFWQWDPRTVAPEFLNPPSEDALMEAMARTITVPVVMVRGTLSDLVTEDEAAYFREITPHVEILEAQGVGHMFTGDHNDVFAAALLDHLG